MNQEFWSEGETWFLYPLARSTRWRKLGADYPALCWDGLSGLGKLRPRLGLSVRYFASLLRVASRLHLIIFWGPNYPALRTGQIIRWGKKLRPHRKIRNKVRTRSESCAMTTFDQLLRGILSGPRRGPDYPVWGRKSAPHRKIRRIVRSRPVIWAKRTFAPTCRPDYPGLREGGLSGPKLQD